MNTGDRVTTKTGHHGHISHQNDKLIWVVRDGDYWETPYENDGKSVWPEDP